MKKIILILLITFSVKAQVVPFSFMLKKSDSEPTVLNYNWDTATPQDADWTFTNPEEAGGLSATSTNSTWSWDDGDTPSTNVGPTTGQGGDPDGYIYIENSSAEANEVYDMELVQNIDASAYDIELIFYTNQRGNDNNVTCVIQTNENGAGWVDRGTTFGGASDPDKVATSGTDVWVQRTVDLTGLISNALTKIRFHLVNPASGSIANCDYGLDTITITLTPK